MPANIITGDERRDPASTSTDKHATHLTEAHGLRRVIDHQCPRHQDCEASPIRARWLCIARLDLVLHFLKGQALTWKKTGSGVG